MRAASVGGAFTMNEPCPTCRGRGLVVDDPCPTCHGSGRGMSNRTISARIPAGVKDGQRIRLRGKGANGERGGPPGDLYVTVKVAAAPAVRPQGRQPHPHRAGQLRRGRARRRHQGADARRRPGHRSRSRRAPRTAGRSGSAAAACTRKDGHKGDLLVTVEVQVPAALDDEGPGGRRGLPRRHGGVRPPRQPVRRAAPVPGARRDRACPGERRPGPEVPVYVISVAAELTGLHPQTLRTYDRLGLVRPGPHRRRRPALLVARHRAAPRGRRADLDRHRPRGRPPDPRARAPGRRPAAPGRRARARPGRRGVHPAPGPRQPAPPRTFPRCAAPLPTGQSVTVWRRGRS